MGLAGDVEFKVEISATVFVLHSNPKVIRSRESPSEFIDLAHQQINSPSFPRDTRSRWNMYSVHMRDCGKGQADIIGISEIARGYFRFNEIFWNGTRNKRLGRQNDESRRPI